jgi:hypothetical protein
MAGKSAVMFVFMPPLEHLEDYLELVTAVEATAAELDVKVVLEGYPPAARSAVFKLLQVTPDPGVIEVNIHPAHNWGELVDHTEFLYEAAHQSRLSTEKFMLDGRHTGHGRWQPFRAGRGDARRQPLPAPAGPAGESVDLLAQPSRPELSLQRPLLSVRRVRRRASTRRATIRCTKSRLPSTSWSGGWPPLAVPPALRCPGSWTGRSATS